MLSSPILNWIIEKHKMGKDVSELVNENSNTNDEIYLGELGFYPKSEVEYYLNYFNFLKEGNFLEELNIDVSGKITPDLVKGHLANISRIIFEVTDICNIDCHYCAYGSLYNDYDPRVGKNLDFNQAKNLLDYVFELSNSSVSTSYKSKLEIGFYGGEPTVNFKFIKKIIDYINLQKLENIEVIYSMTTNGILLKKYMDTIVKENFRLWISIDGDREANSFRVFHNGKESFDKLIENIDALKNTYPDYFDKKVDFHAVLNSKTTVERTYSFIKGKWGKTPIVSEITDVGLEVTNKDWFEQMYKNKDSNFNSLNKMESPKLINDFFLNLPKVKKIGETVEKLTPFIKGNYNDLIYVKEKEYIPTGTCVPFSIGLFLTVNGKLLPCEHVGQQYVLGMVTNDSVQIDFQKIADIYNGYYASVYSRCNQCEQKLMCSNCMLQSEYKDGMFQCNDFMTSDVYKGFLSEQISTIENSPNVYESVMVDLIEKNV
jgi:uncharacterized protein